MCQCVCVRALVYIFSIPTGLSSEATQMISEILQENRYRRPTADQCLQNDFICNFIMPKSLPIYCLLREPRPEDIPMDDGMFTCQVLIPSAFYSQFN